MDYNAIKKLDEDSLKQLQEGIGPSDECICHLFTSPEKGKGITASIKKAFGSISKPSFKKAFGAIKRPTFKGMGRRSVTVPLTYQRGGNGIFTTRREVQRTGACGGKCGCDNEKFFLKDSDLSIRITTPDISSICPCPTDCMPDKARIQDNIKVTIEHAETQPTWVNSQASAIDNQKTTNEDDSTKSTNDTESTKTTEEEAKNSEEKGSAETK